MQYLYTLLTLILLSLSTLTYADFIIEWTSGPQGFSLDGTPQNLLLPNVGDTARADLVFAGLDTQVDSVLYSDGSTNGDDVILDTRTLINTDGKKASEKGLFTFSTQMTFLGSNVYMRVFQGDLEEGTSFLVSPVFSVVDRLTGVDTISFGNQRQAFSSVEAYVVVPEPSTAILVLLGILVSLLSLGTSVLPREK